MRNLLLSLSSSSLAALALLAPAQAQSFPGSFPGGFPGSFPEPFSPGTMGQLDRMCNQNRNQEMNISLPGLDQTLTRTTMDGSKSWVTDCERALEVYNNLGRAGFKAHVDATRAMASAQSQSAMMGGIGSIFSGLISAASNRSSSDTNAQQQTIASQQRQIDQLKQLILAQQAAQSSPYNQQQTQYNNVQQLPYTQQATQTLPQYNTERAPQAALRQTNLF